MQKIIQQLQLTFNQLTKLQYYLIEVRLLAQIWILKKRYSDFDRMHIRLVADLEFRAAENLPDLPPKKFLFNRNPQFIQDRMRALNRYIKLIILIYEAIESPILQRFLEIDTNFNPNYEYESIEMNVGDSDDLSLFLEGDKLSKVKKKFIEQNVQEKKLTKIEEQEQYLLSQFTRKDLPKHRYYNPLLSPPLTDDLDLSSDILDEFHGHDLYQFGNEEGLSFSSDSLNEEQKFEEQKESHNLFSQTFEDSKIQKGKQKHPINLTEEDEDEFFENGFSKSKPIIDKIDKLIRQSKHSQGHMNENNKQNNSAPKYENTLDNDLMVNDEYEQIDENTCKDMNRLRVKKVSKICNKLIQENAELFRLSQKTNEMIEELDEAQVYFEELNNKTKEVALLIKKINANPTKLQKIKKRQIVNAMQQEIENEQDYEDEQIEPQIKRSNSIPSASTGIIGNHPEYQQRNRAMSRQRDEFKFV